jgi:hypothetical protein
MQACVVLVRNSSEAKLIAKSPEAGTHKTDVETSPSFYKSARKHPGQVLEGHFVSPAVELRWLPLMDRLWK